MKITKFFQKTLTTSAGIALALVSFASTSPPVLSEEGFSWWQGADRGNPAGRVPAGTRNPNSQCPVKAPLTALVPAYGAQSIAPESRTLWLYVPYSQGSEAVKSTEFILRDADGAAVYTGQGKLQAPEEPGIVGVEFPSGLEVGETYKWELYVDVDCGSQASSESEYLYGSVKLAELSAELQQKLESEADPLKRYKLYADAEFWYGALTELAEARAQGQDNQAINSAWAELLDSAVWESQEEEKNLEYIITAPIVSYRAEDGQ